MPEFRTLHDPVVSLAWPGLVAPSDGPLRVQVALHEAYQEQYSHVEIVTWPLPAGLARDRWIVRGLPLAPFLREVLKSWARAERSFYFFRPAQRLAQPLIDSLVKLDDPSLVSAFDKLREQGLLPPLRRLSRKTWPRELPWEAARFCLVEWPGAAGPG